MRRQAFLWAMILFCALAPELSGQQTFPRIVPGVDGFTIGTQTRSHYYLLLPNRESAWYTTVGIRYPDGLPGLPENGGDVTRQLETGAGFIQTLAGDRRYAPAALDLLLSADGFFREVSDATTRVELYPTLTLRLSSGPDRSPWATSAGEVRAWTGLGSSLVVSGAQGAAPHIALPRAGFSASLRRAVFGSRLMIEASGSAEQVFELQDFRATAAERSPWMLVYPENDRGPTTPFPRAAGGWAELALRSRLARFRWYTDWAIEAVLGAQTAAGADTLDELRGVWRDRAADDTSFSWDTGITVRTRHVPVFLDLSLHAGITVDARESSRRRGYILFETRAVGD
ncbi:MAG: hypothetical protein ACLFNQ_07355 [Spirochaetaceae bacterium]